MNSTSSQEEIFDAIIQLQKAIDNLKEIPIQVNKLPLKEKLEEALKYKAEDWTKESFEALQIAIREAKIVYNSEKVTQVDVDRKVAILNKAIAELEEKRNELPENPNQPDFEKPGTNQPSIDKPNTNRPEIDMPNSVKPIGQKPAKNVAIPKTGETAQPFGDVIGMLAAAAVVLVWRKRNR